MFGTIGARAVPGTVLVPLLTDLNMSPSAARTLLHRMRARGLLTADRVGRVAIYRLAGSYAAHYQQITFGETAPEWSGSFHALVYDIPETQRQDRDRLREQAFLAGFGALRTGLLIGVRDPGEWAAAWLDRPDVMVERVQVGCDLATARRLADRAWDLSGIATRIDQLRGWFALVERRVHHRRIAGAPALATLYQVWQRFVEVQIDIPALPVQLYPGGWSADDAQAALYRLNEKLLPLARRHAQTVIDRVGAAGLIEREARTPLIEQATSEPATGGQRDSDRRR
ncbi:MAG: hypothetical protein ACRDMV_08870 [Streptosporangiales bacterium]